MTKKFDQEAKERVGCLIEDRILAEVLSVGCMRTGNIQNLVNFRIPPASGDKKPDEKGTSTTSMKISLLKTCSYIGRFSHQGNLCGFVPCGFWVFGGCVVARGTRDV